MSGTPNPKSTMGNAIKIYLFPALVTILATLIWRDVTEMRSDIKALLAQSNIDKTDIQNLKRDVQVLEQAVFNKKITATSIPPLKDDNKPFDVLSSIIYQEIFTWAKHFIWIVKSEIIMRINFPIQIIFQFYILFLCLFYLDFLKNLHLWAFLNLIFLEEYLRYDLEHIHVLLYFFFLFLLVQ